MAFATHLPFQKKVKKDEWQSNQRLVILDHYKKHKINVQNKTLTFITQIMKD